MVQDVLLKVFDKIEAFRGDSALSSWIYRITFNTAMSRLRRTKAMRTAEVAEIEIGATISDETAAAYGSRRLVEPGRRIDAEDRAARRVWRGRSIESAGDLSRAGDPA